MLVRLQSKMQHLASLVTLLVHKLVAYDEQTREAGLHNFVKVLPILALNRLISKGTADGEQTLQTSEDGTGIVGVEELEGEVHKSRPSARKVALQNALEDGNKL
jgi:hypothetical protein